MKLMKKKNENANLKSRYTTENTIHWEALQVFFSIIIK